RFRHSARVVAAVEGEVSTRAAGAIAEMSVAPDQPAHQPLGIGIDEQLVVVEAKSPLRVIWSVDAVAIGLAGRHVIEIAVPDILCPLRQRDALDLAAAVAIEQAQLDLLGVRREQRKISSAPVPGG